MRFSRSTELVLKSLNILLVEDDVATMGLMVSLLEKTPHKIFKASEGEDAIEILRDNPDIDLIILDYHLPKMDGATFCNIVKGSSLGKSNPNLWIVAHTYEQREDLIKEMFDVGVDDYLPKPVVPGLFYIRILAAQYNIQRHGTLLRRIELRGECFWDNKSL
jgi:CheY-like chemotaxis protein